MPTTVTPMNSATVSPGPVLVSAWDWSELLGVCAGVLLSDGGVGVVAAALGTGGDFGGGVDENFWVDAPLETGGLDALW
jgi:hypothetical protein